MIIDLETANPTPSADNYDVVICGSGPAGITTALKLAAKGRRILLLEGGGFEYSPQSQSIYKAKSVGETYYGIESCRLRYFGGTSGHWGGLCGIFDPLDFEARDIWDLPGWPISHGEVYKHLNEAKTILDLPKSAFADRMVKSAFEGGIAKAGLAQSPPTRFGEKYRRELESSERIDVFLNANVTGLAFSPDGKRIGSIRVQNYRGSSLEIAAPFFVLCLGAMENARFLLAADQQNNGAFSAQTDFIGRCFMEHFNVELGRFVTLDEPFWRDNSALELTTTPELAQADGLGTGAIAVAAKVQPVFYGRLAPLRKLRRDIACSTPTVTSFMRRYSDFRCSGDGVVTTLLEQTPNPNSRVRLDTDKDQFDIPRPTLEWRFSEQDQKTIKGAALALGRAMAGSSLARLRIDDGVLNGDAIVGEHCHQMGTTRMSQTGATGVVNSDCRVHGVDNLYIGGSSVFATGGGVNPTFTIVCLALRMGEHLAAKLNSSANG